MTSKKKQLKKDVLLRITNDKVVIQDEAGGKVLRYRGVSLGTLDASNKFTPSKVGTK